MTTAGHVEEHCRPPRRRVSRYQHGPWVCDCGRAWLSTHHCDIGSEVALSWWTWREWLPAARSD